MPGATTILQYKVDWMVMWLKQVNGGQRHKIDAQIKQMALFTQKNLVPTTETTSPLAGHFIDTPSERAAK